MRIAFFDTILEANVINDLAGALTSLGANIFQTGKVWQGHQFPKTEEEKNIIHDAIDRVNAFDPDLIFVVRQSSLTEDMIKRLRKRKRKIFVWLPDDPVLYKTYSRTIDLYDLTLHCGPKKVLKFYDDKRHKPGVYFPFWASPERLEPAHYAPNFSSLTASFFGNFSGRIKKSRIDTLQILAQDLDINIHLFGKGELPPNIQRLSHQGQINTETDMRKVLSQYHFSINLPQNFETYKDTRWWLPELTNMGSFDIPSRIIQFGAMKLPIITVSEAKPSEHFPTQHFAPNDLKLRRFAANFLNNNNFGETVADRNYQTFLSGFTAQNRAEYLLRIFEYGIKNLSFKERVWGYQN